jgi:RNA polymerase sigma-70 factor (ECF subfamily)
MDSPGRGGAVLEAKAPTGAPPDERALVERCRAGDERAYVELIDRYGPAVRRFARRLLSEPEAVEEVVQDTFVQFFRGVGRIRGEARLTTWLYRVTANAAKMRLRAERRRRRVPRDKIVPIDADGHMLHIPDWTRTPEREALAAELRAHLERAISDLPADLRAAYVLAEIEGLPHAEVGRALGLRRQTVKTRVHRARLRLRDALASYAEVRS